MGIEYNGSHAKFVGEVSADEAERLLQWLLESKNLQREQVTVDLNNCQHVHGAVLQVLLKAKPRVVKWPNDSDFARWLASGWSQEQEMNP